MIIKAGKYTLAVTMIAAGILMLMNVINGGGLFKDLWMYSPAILILFGLEIIILNLVFGYKPDYKVQVSVGSLILIAIIVAIFTAGTNHSEVQQSIYDRIFNW